MAFGDQKFGIVVRARTGQARRELGKLRADSVSAFGGAQQSVVGLTTALGAAGVALGVVSAGIAAFALKTSAGLETAFSEVATISSFTADETARLRAEVRALALEVGGNEIQAVKALYQIISAGATDANDASVLLGQSVRLAKAGLADLDITAKALSSVVNSFGVEIGIASGRLADMFFETVRLGQTTLPELAASLGRVAKIANVAGVDVEELLATIAALTKAGLSTDEAITAVRQALLAIAAPGSQAAAAFEKMGVAAGAATLKQRGLAGVFAEIGKAVQGDIQQLKELIPNIRAIVAAAVFADEEGLQLLIDSTLAIGGASESVRTALGEFADDLEFKLGKAAARAKGQMADLGRELTPFAIEVLGKLSDELEFVVDLFGEWFGLLLRDGDRVAEVLRSIGAAILLIGAALAGNAVAAGIRGLGAALQFLVLNVLTAPGGVAAGLASLVNPITAIGAAVGIAALLIGKHVLSLKRAAVEAERIADSVERSNQTIQNLGQVDLVALENVVAILSDFRAQIVEGTSAGPTVLSESLASAGNATVELERDLSALLGTFESFGGAAADATAQVTDFVDEQQRASAADFARGLGEARETIKGFGDETQRALGKIAPAFTEGLIRDVQGLDTLLATLRATLSNLRAEAELTEEPEAGPVSTAEVDEAAAALARLDGALLLIREDLAGIQSEVGEAFARVAREGEEAFGPGGALSPEAIRELGAAFDDLDVDELVDQLFRFGEVESLVDANNEAFGRMLDVLREVKKQAGELLTEDQLATFQLIIEAVADAIEVASAEMAAALRELKDELDEVVAKAKIVRSEFRRGAQAFASSMATAVVQTQNVLDAFVAYVKQRVVAVLAAEFAKLALSMIPGGSFLGNLIFGGGGYRQAQAPRPISREVQVGARGSGVQVNVGIGPESMVEVITGDFRARRALFRLGTRPEQINFDRR